MRSRRSAFIVALTVACASAACTSQHPAASKPQVTQPAPTATGLPSPTAHKAIMRLSQTSGKVGDQIRITVSDCPATPGQDSLTWHDSAQYQGSLNHREPVPPYSLVPVLRSGASLTATFQVLPTYARGRGILDKFCTGNNAVANFTVR